MFRSSQEAKLATRSYFQGVALDLAEAGLEEGLYAINTSSLTSANGWTLVTGSTTDYQKTITAGLDFTQASGAIYIRVDSPSSITPTVTATGTVTIPGQPILLKQLRVTSSQRHLWANGIVATGSVTFSGNNVIDSYDSSLGVYNATTNRSDQATVGSLSTALDPVVVGSLASIYGYVSTGATAPVVGSGGRIYGATTPAGTAVDPTRIRRDFTANLPSVTAPTGTSITLSAISGSLTLPRVGDLPNASGRYVYTTSSLGISGASSVSITGPVDLIVTGNVSTSGNASVAIAGLTASLNLYTPGSISIGGNGLTNGTNVPSKATIWGTAPTGTTQTVSIAGNGSFIGTLYAPNAAISITGNGATSGALIGKTITMGGNGLFHYDTRLATTSSPLDVTYAVNSWSELTGAPGTGAAFARDNRSPFNTLF